MTWAKEFENKSKATLMSFKPMLREAKLTTNIEPLVFNDIVLIPSTN